MILWHLPKRLNLPNRRDFFKFAAAGSALPAAYASVSSPQTSGKNFTQAFRGGSADPAALNPILVQTGSRGGTVAISILSGYHTNEFLLRPAHGATLVVEHNIGPNGELAFLKNEKHVMRVKGSTKVTGHYGSPAHFRLAVPGHAEREYFGRLSIKPHGDHLLAIVDMDLETAVASIVNAEGTDGLPFEAKRVQAIATRSYLLAAKGLRHIGFDFCDQEHCQLLLSAPSAINPSAKAASSTHGQVLTYKGSVVAALYSANCGGHTRTLHQAGWQDSSPPPETYPFFGVSCPLQGPVSGHRVGLCQSGAIEIAKSGKPATEILSYYFPNTSLGSVHFSAGTGVHSTK